MRNRNTAADIVETVSDRDDDDEEGNFEEGVSENAMEDEDGEGGGGEGTGSQFKGRQARKFLLRNRSYRLSHRLYQSIMIIQSSSSINS